MRDAHPGFAKEGCFEELVADKPDGYMTSFFRIPRALLYSEYLQNLSSPKCDPPNGTSIANGFAIWVDHFYQGLKANGTMTETKSYKCYHPYNMQARAMSRLCTRDIDLGRNYTYSLHLFDPRIQTVEEMETHLADNMYRLDFAGITEFYAASMCIYQYLTDTPYFPECLSQPLLSGSSAPAATIKSSTSPSNSHKKGSGPSESRKRAPHPQFDVPEQVWNKVDALTKYDRKLYTLALRRFACGVAHFEQDTGLSLNHLIGPVGWEYVFDSAESALIEWGYHVARGAN